MENLFIIFLLAVSFLILAIDIKKLYIPNTLNIIFFVGAVCYRGIDIYEIENGIIGAGVYTLPLLFFMAMGQILLEKRLWGLGT